MANNTVSQVHVKRKKPIKIGAIIRYVILLAVALLMLYPIIWMVGATFKTNAEIFSSIGFWPKSFDFTPYIKGWQTGTEFTFATYFINTFKIVIPKVVFTLISTVFVSYGFARFDFPFKKILFSAMISTMFLPGVVKTIPMYLLWRDLGFLDTYVPLIAGTLFAQSAFNIFMLVQFMRGIPRDYDEAAMMDGCNSIQFLFKILLPIVRPALVTIGLLEFMGSMNDFMGPLIYISSVEKFPVSVALKMAMDTTSGNFNWNQIIAMSVIALLPSIILFFSASKQFIDGMSTGGLKG
ncbi:oligogalacturonide transport system permease protein [Enterococcus sp. PF1-24]|uniref:carbohydrate ABC transporter permease n=1 Tax=unclassified Enterococcus TaxID=2608891 RepID=UPI002475A2BA|nr:MULTISPECIES: carbohydrate ABC transporter permease [unclassified Enterococcus]MDH6363994.1 oligogalacturonide transport system permease protein [Enterococcus sp. PFB1-1]MDH6401095.1 oligogalacturonide transport system permease protein [Enterococcus sp. PF1-24]